MYKEQTKINLGKCIYMNGYFLKPAGFVFGTCTLADGKCTLVYYVESSSILYIDFWNESHWLKVLLLLNMTEQEFLSFVH